MKLTLRCHSLCLIIAFLGSCASSSLHAHGGTELLTKLRREKSLSPWHNFLQLKPSPHGESSGGKVTYSLPRDSPAHSDGHTTSDGHSESSAHSDGHSTSAGHSESGRKHGLGYSLCLFGAVAFNMSLLYLINHDDPGITYATWQVLSMTLSIFVAVLGYATVRAVCVDIVSYYYGPKAELAASLILFICIFFTNEAVLYLLKAPKNQKILHSGAALGCHFLGFAACYSFADVQRSALLGSTIIGNSFVVVIAALVLAGLSFLAKFVHKWVEKLHEAEREHLEDLKWEKEVEMMEDEAVSLCMGYLLVQTLAFAIRGSHDSNNAMSSPHDVTQRHINLILIGCCVFVALTVLGFMFGNFWMGLTMRRRASIGGHFRHADTLNYEQVYAENDVPWHVRVLMVVLHSFNVAMAWCVLLSAEWQVYSLGFEGSRIAACMLVGIVLTLLAFATIFVLEWIANHVHTRRQQSMDPTKIFRSMTLALGIVIGFAWERSFHVGLHDIAHVFTHSQGAEDFASHLMACGLILIVTPAWAMYVFPMVKETEEACYAWYDKDSDSARQESLQSSKEMLD